MRKNVSLLKKRLPPELLIPMLAVLIALLSVLSMGVGAVFMSPKEAVSAMIGSGDDSHSFIIANYRLPRIILAVLAGAGLAVSGAILQGIIRNSLASPDVIGISKGAGLAAAIVILLFPKSPVAVLPVAAFVGAGLVAVALYLFTSQFGAQPSTLALVGVALGAICHAGIQYLVVKNPVDVNTALVWLSGSLWGRGWQEIIGVLPWLIVLLPLIFLLSMKLDILSLGDDVAEGLGGNVKRSRLFLLAIAVLLAASCVAAVGSIGFVGLVAPHMARRLVGALHHLVLPTSALIGALLVLTADSLGRALIPPLEIPAGIITAVIGAPYFLYLLRRESKLKKS